VTAALVCPDGISVLLFCKGIIAGLRDAGYSRVLVVTDVGSHGAEIQSLGADYVDVPVARFVDPMGDLKYFASLIRVFRRERCDAVLNFSTKPNIYGAVAARLAGIPRVVNHVVGLGAPFVADPTLSSRVFRAVMRVLYRVSMRLSDRVWFTNRNDLAFFSQAGIVDKDRAILTRNYLDTTYYAPTQEPPESVDALRRELQISSDAVVVLMVARLIWPKGIAEFAEAARLLRNRCPQCRLLLVAPPEPSGRQTVPVERVREFERRGNFNWLGFRRDVRALYALCDIAVLPTYYKEGGYPRALLEPMSMGKPLITTTSEDCRDTVEEGRNGLLVPPRDAESLANAIEWLARDPALRRAFGEHSRIKAVTQFEERVIISGALRSAGLAAA
jgi:glycosyltransferase involved in cell wall biosynthesis